MENKTLKMPNKPDPTTQTQNVRVELLKMLYRHDRPPKELVIKASEFEAYVMDKPLAPSDATK